MVLVEPDPRVCDPNPCLNGVCFPLRGGFDCSCKPGVYLKTLGLFDLVRHKCRAIVGGDYGAGVLSVSTPCNSKYFRRHDACQITVGPRV